MGVIPLCVSTAYCLIPICIFPPYWPPKEWVKSHAILLTPTPPLDSIKTSTNKRKEKQMPDKMFKLSDKYADLLIEVWETKIKVVDASRNYPRVTMFYGDLLEFGTVVYYKSRLILSVLSKASTTWRMRQCWSPSVNQ